MATVTIDYEVPIILEGEEVEVPVSLTVNGTYGDHGIGEYEYWGARYRDVQMGWEIDDWEYDKSKYSEEVNQKITEWLVKHDEIVYEEFVKKMED